MKKSAVWMTGTLIVAMGAAGMASAHGDKGPRRGAPQGAPMEMLFQEFDLDGDGKVTAAEVEEARTKRFTEADADGDGFLSPEEMAAQAEKMREARALQRRTARTDAMLKRLDTDEDGKLSPEEAAKFGPADGVATMIERLDTDKDGAVSQAELQAAADRMQGKRRFGRRGEGHRGDRGDRGDRGAPWWMQRN